MIPITKPYLDRDEEAEVLQVIRSGWLVQGPKVAEFETVVASYVGARYAVATSSCTTALHLVLLLAGIGPEDEVIVPSYTFIASANSVIYVGATPVFADIDERTGNIDPFFIEEVITPRTRAIMPVHQLGLAAEMDAILETAVRHNLKVIEDAAPALGATYKGRRVGNIGPLTCFSFHPRKIITSGEGGMITTNDPDLAERARVLRSHGASISDLARHQADQIVFEEYGVLGYNYRMSDLHAALGIAQMRKLDRLLARRQALAQRYNEAFAESKAFLPPYSPPYVPHTYQTYALRLAAACPKTREEIMAELMAQGIATRRGIPPVHLEPYYVRQYGRIRLPVTEAVSESTLFIPLYPFMTDEEQERVIAALKKAVNE